MAHTMGMSMLGVRSWRSTLASAMVGALLVALPVTASAQDIPWGKTPAKSAPKKAPAQAPAVKAPKAQAPAAAAPKAGATPGPAADPNDARERMKAQPFPGDAKGAKAAKDVKEPTLSAPDLEALKSALAPFGTWIDDPERGTLWIPSTKEVGKSFAPYKSSGRWGLDKSGDWSWISDYPWGDIPFHFGNWTWLPPSSGTQQPKQGNAPPAEHGWAWVPGAEYAPAWVVWRLGDVKNPFVGWAPAPPSKKIVNGKLVPVTKEQVLPFFYVPADRLFEGGIARHVVTDRKVGRAAHDATKIFAGNLTACAPGKKNDKAKEQCQGASLWQPASPTLKQAGIAAALIAEPPAAPRSLNDAVRSLAPATKKPATQSKLDDGATTDEAPTTERGKNFVRRCVRTKQHGMRCWTYRWPPLWRGRR